MGWIKKNNKGLSLVELIVVIAIMAVMIGMTALSLSILTGAQAKQAAEKISSQLNEAKTGSMSRYQQTLTLKYETKDEAAGFPSDGFYAEKSYLDMKKDLNTKEVGKESRRVCSKQVQITIHYTNASGAQSFELTETGGDVIISYDRTSGALKTITNAASSLGSDAVLQSITCKTGARTYEIEFTQQTGKHVMKAL